MRVSRAAAVAAMLLALFGVPAALGQTDNPPPVLVSRQLAESQELEPGDVVRLAPRADGAGARAFRIAGIYEPTPDPSRLGSVPRAVRLHLPDRAVDLPAGSLLVLEKALPHDVEAIEDSTFLLTLGWTPS